MLVDDFGEIVEQWFVFIVQCGVVEGEVCGCVDVDVFLYGGDLCVVFGKVLLYVLGECIDLLLLFLIVGVQFVDGGVVIGFFYVLGIFIQCEFY